MNPKKENSVQVQEDNVEVVDVITKWDFTGDQQLLVRDCGYKYICWYNPTVPGCSGFLSFLRRETGENSPDQIRDYGHKSCWTACSSIVSTLSLCSQTNFLCHILQ